MKFIIYVGHPAHVHLFAPFTYEVIKGGDSVLFLARDKDVTLSLLRAKGFDYIPMGKPLQRRTSKWVYSLTLSLKILKICLNYRPDFLIANSAAYLALAGLMMHKPIISLFNTDTTPKIIQLYIKLCSDIVITPYLYPVNYGNKQIRISGCFEYAYLAPDIFEPDQSVLSKYEIGEDNRLILLRFVNSSAIDDFGILGIDHIERLLAINEMLKYGKVIVSCEDELPAEYQYLHLEKNVKYVDGDLQSIEYYADLAWSDSGAVSSECAILGTPCIFQSNKRLSFISDLENYGLVIRTHNFNDSLMLAKNILESNDSKSIWKTKRDIAIKNFTNVTNTLLNLVRGYNTSEENNLL
ncbi:MAG: DUF354 domain-containing protein [Candidatus Cloacimonas sp.]|jgi:predicted glycosyltransferase|nr:DUF354 domain-containing protein [Candidatus Cloacimonas sp.]